MGAYSCFLTMPGVCETEQMALSVPIVPCVRFSGLLERIESFGYVNPGSGLADMRA